MKKLTLNTSVWALLIVVVVSLAGCNEQNLTEPKKYNLLADENHRLNQQLQQCGKETDSQIRLLEQCKQQQAQIKEQQNKTIGFLMDTLEDECKTQSGKLKSENKTLKMQIKQLQGQVEELKDMLNQTQPTQDQNGI